jgi:alkaline phosphatase D
VYIGNENVDTQLLDGYGELPYNIREFYLESRTLFDANNAKYTSKEIVETVHKNKIALMGGPMLGNLKEELKHD